MSKSKGRLTGESGMTREHKREKVEEEKDQLKLREGRGEVTDQREKVKEKDVKRIRVLRR